MKTSSKILLGGAITLVVLALSFVTYARFSFFPGDVFREVDKTWISGSQNVTEEVRDLDGFNRIHAAEGINVMITRGDEFFVKVVADDNIIDFIVTRVEGDLLRVERSKKFKRAKKQDVYVTMPELTDLQVSSGASGKMESEFTGESIQLGSSSGAYVNAKVNYNIVNADASSGAHMDISGIAQQGEYSASSGAQINAKELNVSAAHAGTSSGAEVILGEIKRLSVNASSGGQVQYKGEAILSNINLSSGGSVDRYDD